MKLVRGIVNATLILMPPKSLVSALSEFVEGNDAGELVFTPWVAVKVSAE